MNIKLTGWEFLHDFLLYRFLYQKCLYCGNLCCKDSRRWPCCLSKALQKKETNITKSLLGFVVINWVWFWIIYRANYKGYVFKIDVTELWQIHIVQWNDLFHGNNAAVRGGMTKPANNQQDGDHWFTGTLRRPQPPAKRRACISKCPQCLSWYLFQPQPAKVHPWLLRRETADDLLRALSSIRQFTITSFSFS